MVRASFRNRKAPRRSHWVDPWPERSGQPPWAPHPPRHRVHPGRTSSPSFLVPPFAGSTLPCFYCAHPRPDPRSFSLKFSSLHTLTLTFSHLDLSSASHSLFRVLASCCVNPPTFITTTPNAKPAKVYCLFDHPSPPGPGLPLVPALTTNNYTLLFTRHSLDTTTKRGLD